MHVGRTSRAVGWQPTGFGGYIICMLGELLGLQVGNLQGLEATLFACWGVGGSREKRPNILTFHRVRSGVPV